MNTQNLTRRTPAFREALLLLALGFYAASVLRYLPGLLSDIGVIAATGLFSAISSLVAVKIILYMVTAALLLVALLRFYVHVQQGGQTIEHIAPGRAAVVVMAVLSFLIIEAAKAILIKRNTAITGLPYEESVSWNLIHSDGWLSTLFIMVSVAAAIFSFGRFTGKGVAGMREKRRLDFGLATLAGMIFYTLASSAGNLLKIGVPAIACKEPHQMATVSIILFFAGMAAAYLVIAKAIEQSRAGTNTIRFVPAILSKTAIAAMLLTPLAHGVAFFGPQEAPFIPGVTEKAIYNLKFYTITIPHLILFAAGVFLAVSAGRKEKSSEGIPDKD